MSLAVIGVDGPTSSTDGQAAVFDGTTGKKIKSAGYTPREVLTADRTYYVRTDGSDSNNGLANTSGGAFLTWQKAWDTILTLDLNGFNVTVQAGDGTYTGTLSIQSPQIGGLVTFQGNSGTPANVVLSTSSAAINVNCPCPLITFKDFKITTSGGDCLDVQGGASVAISGLNFGTCADGQIRVIGPGFLTIAGNYTITGGGTAHWLTQLNGAINGNTKTITLTGTPAFSWFARCETAGLINFYQPTFSGSATGSRYAVTQNSVINVYGGSTSLFPGNSAGSTSTGGQYT